MTKKILFVIGLMMATVSGIASNVATEQNSGKRILLQTFLEVGYDNPTGNSGVIRPKAPMRAPEVYLDDHTLSFSCNNGYTLELIDTTEGDEDTIVYSDFIPEDVLTWQLPSYLAGNYTIRLIYGNWLFVGNVELY